MQDTHQINRSELSSTLNWLLYRNACSRLANYWRILFLLEWHVASTCVEDLHDEPSPSHGHGSIWSISGTVMANVSGWKYGKSLSNGQANSIDTVRTVLVRREWNSLNSNSWRYTRHNQHATSRTTVKHKNFIRYLSILTWIPNLLWQSWPFTIFKTIVLDGMSCGSTLR